MELPVVFVDHSAYPGGGQLGLYRYLVIHRDKCRAVIFMTGGPMVERIKALGVETHVLSDRDYTGRSILTLLPALTRVLRGLGPAVLVANSLYAGASLAMVRSIVGSRKLYYSRVSMDSLQGAKRLLILSLFSIGFDGFIANSHWTASCIPQFLSKRGLQVAYPISGISAEPPKRLKSFEGSETLRIVTLSRPDRWKGIDILLEALELLSGMDERNLTLDIYGGSFFSESDYLTDIRLQAKNLKYEVNFHGHVDNVDQVLQSSDIFVLPTRQPEPFGQVVPQALSNGCICIVPNEGGPLEIVEHGINGYHFEARSASSLARAILHASVDRKEMSRVSIQAQDRSTIFSDEISSAMLIDAIRTLSKPSISESPERWR